MQGGCQMPQNTTGRKQADELLKCKPVLLFIKRKDDSEGETKKPEGGTKPQRIIHSLYKLIKKLPFASWITELLWTSDSFLPPFPLFGTRMFIAIILCLSHLCVGSVVSR